MDSQVVRDQITEGLNPALTDLNLVVEDVTVQSAGKRRLLRISVARDVTDLLDGDPDSPVEPLTLDEVADASRLSDEWLEESAVMGERPFTLEVTSLGVAHPLTTAAQFRRNVGRLIEATLKDQSQVTGRVASVTTRNVVVSDESGETVSLDVSQISKAKVQVEFTRADQKEGI